MKKHKKKILGKEKGITLIALVITIIVLLILAGVSIAMLTGDNGILTQAQNSKKETERANIIEQVRLDILEKQTEKEGENITSGELEEILKKYFSNEEQNLKDIIAGTSTDKLISKEDETIKIDLSEIYNGDITDGTTPTPPETGPSKDENGYFEETSTIDGSEPSANNPTIPEGFKPIDTETSSWEDVEENVNNGLVIQDKVGNEFVWIPVATAVSSSEAEGTTNKAMAIEKDGNYRGLLYDFDASGSEVRSGCTTTTSSNREPAFLTDSTYGDNSTSNADAEGQKIVTETGLQNEYNNMIESVKIYHGFYVGRYELGLDGSNNPTSRKAKEGEVTTADATNSNTKKWYGLYSKSKEYAKESDNKSTVSSMIWGSQYDAMLNWMQANGEIVNQNNSLKTNKSYNTGSEANDLIKNVFDLYGCHYEWTLEADDSLYRVIRGGISGYHNVPSLRDDGAPTASSSYGSTRLTLYVALDTE